MMLRSTVLMFAISVFLSGCVNQPDLDISGDKVRTFTSTHEAQYAAHWIKKDIVLLAPETAGENFVLAAFAHGIEHGPMTTRYTLHPMEMSQSLKNQFPHLASFKAFQIELHALDIRAQLRGEPAIIGLTNSHIVSFNIAQFGHALDDIYTAGPNDADEVSDFGARRSDTGYSIKLWAPTARQVDVAFYGENKNPVQSIEMDLDLDTGVWNADIPEDQLSFNYQYKIELFHPESRRVETVKVTDPYSLCLSANSEYSCLVDLNDPASKPEGWDDHTAPALSRPEAQIIYEAHIGDFSGMDQSTSERVRGRFKAFTEPNTAPMNHLSDLKDAGLTTFHILPAYDIGTVNEVRQNQIRLSDTVAKACTDINDKAAFCNKAAPEQTLRALLESYDPLSPNAQAVVEAIDEQDDYNWGYDPVHYTVPEGSYATNADGITRIVEFREMVQTLHEMGLRVVMDVVYNHTFKSGMDEKSVLDKIVPGYYHRRHPLTGEVEHSTCCENTATERVMMGKLMTDSLVTWARDYRIDGFRFDLMGHQPKDLMLRSRDAVIAVDPDNYFYGEGWNFGEVANNARFIQASQTELTGTEIGTFTDRLRDAVRGGTPFLDGDNMRAAQGIGSGQWMRPNALASTENRADYDNNLNLVRLGLAGNLKSFELLGRDGTRLSGTEIDYLGAPAGYAQDPADTINYVSKHDNQTLWDNHQYRLPHDMMTEDRVRLHVQSLSYPIYAQGIPFIHLGSELLRSKSFLRDSYNYGHWFNAIDFDLQSNNYNVGLPPAAKDEANWPLIEKLITENQGRDIVTNSDIELARDQVLSMLKVRSSSPLFSLPTGKDIKSRVRFLNTGPDQVDGLIIMSIDDGFHDSSLEDLDTNFSEIIVAFNHAPEAIDFTLGNTENLQIHPAIENTSGATTQSEVISKGIIKIPGFTTLVFVRSQF